MNNKTPLTLYKSPNNKIIIDPVFLVTGVLIIFVLFLVIGFIGVSNYNLLLTNTII